MLLRTGPLTIALGLIIVATCAGAQPGEVTVSLPSSQYPTGLAWDGEHIWLSDRDSGWLYAVDTRTGEFVDSVICPSFSPLGLAYGDGCLWISGYREDGIYKLDLSSRQVTDIIGSPSSLTFGLTWQGGYLWACDAQAREIVKLDPADGTPLRSIKAPSRYAHGLGCDGTYLWVSDRRNDRIYMVEPEQGWVVFALEAPGPYPRDLAWDGSDLWVVDYQTDSLYAVATDGDSNPPHTSPKRARIRFTFKVRGEGPDAVDKCDIYLAVPHADLEHQYLLTDISFVPVPLDFVSDRWGQEFAHFTLHDLTPGQTERMSYEVSADLSAYHQLIIPERVGSLNRIPSEVKRKYTVDGARLLIEDPIIRHAIKEAVGDETNPYWIARRIFEYVGDRIEYERVGGWDTAPNVLKRGTGSCSEYSFVFAAMARGAGLPTRFCAGVLERGDEASMDDVFHRWTEVYLPDYGWVPFDVNAGDKEWQADRVRGIGSHSNRALITTIGGGDSEYADWGYNYGYSYSYSGRASVDISVYADWDPLE
jgi:hypothetical protein